MDVKVSVIVPVYNTETYLEQCVESLINQTLKEAEFIFVDDGSTDLSVKILEKYQQNDSRIKIMKQQNQYAGTARNKGMSAATGKYLMFLDSDDFFELNMLEEMYNTAEKSNAEVTVTGYYLFDGDKITGENRIPSGLPENCFSPSDLGGHVFDTFIPAPWTKLYLKSFLDKYGIRFQSIKNCNDLFFYAMVMWRAEKIKTLDGCCIYYRVNNPSSLQNSIKSDKTNTCLPEALAAIKNELKVHNAFEGNIRKSYINLSCEHITGYLMNCYEGNFNQMESVFERFKEHLIPGIFDSTEEIPTDTTVFDLAVSSCFSEFLYNENKKLQKDIENISEEFRSSRSFILGNAILAIPRAIRDLLRKH